MGSSAIGSGANSFPAFLRTWPEGGRHAIVDPDNSTGLLARLDRWGKKAVMPNEVQLLLPRFEKQHSSNWTYLRSPAEVKSSPSLLGYAHHILRAFEPEVLGLTGVLCIDARPTVYFRRDHTGLNPVHANNLHRKFWNQGIATVLVLADPTSVRIYSAQARPVAEGTSARNGDALILESANNIADLLELESLLHEIAGGQFYTQNARHFNQTQTVDEFLLRNLSDARDQLVLGPAGLKEEAAHALLGRLIFLCYLTDRGVIDWGDYEREVGRNVDNIRQLLERYEAADGIPRLSRLMSRLHRTFHGSMFDHSLGMEGKRLRPAHYDVLRAFFSVAEVRTGQRSLGFWAYDFSVVPVETISAIYEDFLTKEDAEGKRKQGAFYTPPHLVEMLVDLAIRGDVNWAQRNYLDPACGSGIFLVTLFNRLASNWVFSNGTTSYKKRADALLRILHTQLRGVDIARTACRIASFSLYLAFLDQFEPRDLREFARLSKRKRRAVLPRLLRFKHGRWRESHPPTILQGDFLSEEARSDFHYIVGNPPWAGRGTQQKAWEFMRRAPHHLVPGGRGSLLLPAKVLFNKTDQLQAAWFGSLTIARVVNLADFRHLLFENAKCPALIVQFTNSPAAPDHQLLYDVPKVSGTDCRQGIVTIFPRDQKQVRQKDILAAARARKLPAFWKRHFSATPRDLKLLDLMDDMPKLAALAKRFDPKKRGLSRWWMAEGIKPSKTGTHKPWWNEDRSFLDARSARTALFVFEEDCEPVGRRFHPKVERMRDQGLFEPPLVVISYSLGKVAYCNFPVLFEHSLRVITPSTINAVARAEESDLLLFLTLYLRSALARYYFFHTSANWGIERDKVHLFELAELPFPLPGDDYANKDAARIMATVTTQAKNVGQKLSRRLTQLHAEREKRGLARESEEFCEILAEFNGERAFAINRLQNTVERHIARYFNLTEEEIILVKDTKDIGEPSATPTNWPAVMDARVPSLTFVDEDAISAYASTVVTALNEWAQGGEFCVAASAVQFTEQPFVLVTLRQVKKPKPFKIAKLDKNAQKALARIHGAAILNEGYLEYPRAVILFDGPLIHLLRPARLMHWTRTSALNDADLIFAEVVQQRHAIRK